MSVSMKIDISGAKAKLKDLAQVKAQAAPQIYTEFLKNTPIKSGNARANTDLVNNRIEANYPYAQVLDQGRSYRDGQMRGSDQAPRGMSQPTMEFAKKLLAKLIKQIAGRRK